MIRILAAFIFFTRLPFWRIAEVPASAFKRVLEGWPFVGWLTGGVTAAVLGGASCLWPPLVAVILAVICRLLLTGALHEDGLADFCDGFGGGTTRERTLAIMKDSHIGTYGVLALILYEALLIALLATLPVQVACLALLCGDPWSKCCAAQLVNLLPYARKEEEAKARVVYERMTPTALLSLLIGGITPTLIVLACLTGTSRNILPETPLWLCAFIAPLLMLLVLVRLMKRRIQGYTGDCCGATFLLCELSFYLILSLLIQTL